MFIRFVDNAKAFDRVNWIHNTDLGAIYQAAVAAEYTNTCRSVPPPCPPLCLPNMMRLTHTHSMFSNSQHDGHGGGADLH